MPQTKSGKQFSVLSKGRQIYQQYEYTKSQCMPEDAREVKQTTVVITPDIKRSEISDDDQSRLVKQELIDLHVNYEIFAHCTIDAINKITELITQQDPGVLKCQKRYKIIIQKI